MERIITCAKCGIKVKAKSTLKKYCNDCLKEAKKEHFNVWKIKNSKHYAQYMREYGLKRREKYKKMLGIL